MANKLKLKDSVIQITDEKKEQEKIVSGDEIFDQDGELVVDVYETNSDFVVLAAIAGIQIKDIDISLEKDMMII